MCECMWLNAVNCIPSTPLLYVLGSPDQRACMCQVLGTDIAMTIYGKVCHGRGLPWCMVDVITELAWHGIS